MPPHLRTKNKDKSVSQETPPRYHCKICGIALVPRDQVVFNDESSFASDTKDRRLSLHHIDYQKNIAIRVCPACHVKLHNSLKKDRYGIDNVIRKDGTKRGPITPGKYPDKILD